MTGQNKNALRIPSLDGFRAVAILLVILCHASRTLGFPRVEALDFFYTFGSQGVEIFFVLSGFLITKLLVDEQDQNGFISLKNFYIRRAFRILPASFFYIIFITVLAFNGFFEITLKEILSCVFFFRGWVSPAESHEVTAHFWTLSIEEQFYLLWPAFLFLMPKNKHRLITLVLIFAAPFWRQVNIYIWGANGLRAGFLDTRYDGLLFGCLLALTLKEFSVSKVGSFVARSYVATMAAVFLSLFVHSQVAQMLPGFIRVFYKSIFFASITILIFQGISQKLSLMSAILNTKFCEYIGKLSYSLYLWQQLFFKYEIPGELALFRSFPLNLVLCFLFAELSYRLIELPFLKLRVRFLYGADGGT